MLSVRCHFFLKAIVFFELFKAASFSISFFSDFSDEINSIYEFLFSGFTDVIPIENKNSDVDRILT